MTTELNPNVDAPAPQPGSKRKRALLILLVVVLIAGIGWALYYVLVGRWHESTDDAYVQGNVVSITPQATGTVVSIGADDGMKVTAGQVLVRLDPNDARVAYEQAVANLANTVREVRGLYSAVNAGQADIRARQVAVQKARADIARRSGLVATGAVSAEELAHAREELASAEALQTEVYEIGKREEFGFESLRDWFKALYETLLGSSQGPRMGSFIALYGIANTRALIAEALGR